MDSPDRIEVIQKLVIAKKAKTYLEIGVASGNCFLRISAPRKIAVDVKFCFSEKRKIARHYLSNFKSNIFNRYYQMESDEFFHKYSKLFKKNRIDIAFIDGLHEYNQVIRDVNNCLNYLNEGGIIVLHDCSPPSEEAALPLDKILGRKHWVWMGDVWKSIIYFRSCRHDLNVFVLDIDCGLGIITRGEPDSLLTYSPEGISGLLYQDLEKDRSDMLNLKNATFLERFLKKHRITLQENR